MHEEYPGKPRPEAAMAGPWEVETVTGRKFAIHDTVDSTGNKVFRVIETDVGFGGTINIGEFDSQDKVQGAIEGMAGKIKDWRGLV